jgi:hypothetical protein
MTYVMSKPCPICKRQLTKQKPYRYSPMLLGKTCVGDSLGTNRRTCNHPCPESVANDHFRNIGPCKHPLTVPWRLH